MRFLDEKTWKKVQKGYQNGSKIIPKSFEKGRRKKRGKNMGTQRETEESRIVPEEKTLN